PRAAPSPGRAAALTPPARGRSMARFAVIGGGAWGTALAAHAARIGHDVRLWALEPEVAAEVTERHTNSVYLPEVPLPDTLTASSDAPAVTADAEVLVLVPP